MSDTLLYILLGVLVLFVVLADILRPGPTPADADSLTSADSKCQALRIRQERARQGMKRAGIKSLLEGRPAWQTINPMAAAKPVAKVVQMKRRPR